MLPNGKVTGADHLRHAKFVRLRDHKNRMSTASRRSVQQICWQCSSSRALWMPHYSHSMVPSGFEVMSYTT